MLATRIRQKEGTFYFIAYKAGRFLDKVRFTSRYYFEGEEIPAATVSDHDEVAQFIAGIERSEKGFQRVLNRQKIKQIVNFYETVVSQPMVPGTVLLFTDETFASKRWMAPIRIGHLSEPKGKYLVIDGQHRLAGLHFFQRATCGPERAGRGAMPVVRRTECGFRDGDVCHHQLHPHADQPIAFGRSL